MADFAELGLRFVPVNDAAANKALIDVAANSDKAEVASKRLTATQQSAANTAKMVADANRINTSALGQMAQAIAQADAAQRAALASTGKLTAEVQKASAQAKAASVSFIDFHDAASRDFATQYSRQMGAVGQTHMAGVKSSKALTQATLNMTRQFADVGVTAAMGMSPLMILIQQGPQIADAFQMAKAQGLGFSAVLAGLRAQVVGLLAVLAPFLIAAGAIAAVVGGPLLLATKELNDGNKDLAKSLGLTEEQLKKVKNQGITTGDVLKGTFLAAGAALKEAFAPQLEWLSDAISKTYQFILKATLGAVEGIVKMFGGAIGLIGGLWKNFPAIVGDAVVSGANFALAAVEKMVNGAIGLLNKLIGQANALSAKVGGPQFSSLANASVGRIANGNAGALADLRAAQVKGEAAALAGLAGAYKAVEASILKVATARIREEAGTAKATKAVKDHTKALKDQKEALDRTQPIAADMSKAVDLSEVAATKLPKAVSDLKTIHDEAYKAKDAMEDFYRAANEAGSGVDQLFDGLRNRDWMSAVAGLLRAAKAVQDAFGKNGTNKTTAGKIGAIAGIADGIGQAIGGTAGSVLSGAAGGAMGGVSLALALGGPVGWIAAAGAAIGGLFGLFGSNSKKQAEKEAKAQAAREAEAQRQAQILQQRRQIEVAYVEATGNALEILEAQRKAELEGIDESNKALALALYAAQDQKRRDTEGLALMRQLQAMDDAILGTTVALTAARADELKALDPANRHLAELIYARQDEAAAMDKQRAAAEAATLAADALAAANAANAAADADAAARMRGLQIQLMEALGDTAGATAMKRADTLAGLPAGLKVWQEALFGMEDVAVKRAEAEKAQAANDAAVDTARSALTAAYDRERGTLVSMRDEARGVSDSLRQWSRSLSFSEAGGGNLAQRQNRMMAELEGLVRRVQAGDLKASGDITGMGDAALAVAKQTARTQLEYAREVAKVRNLTEAAAVVADSQVNVAEAQLAALDASVSGLIAINDNVISVRQGIDNLTAALGVQKAAQTAASGFAGGGFVGGSDGTLEPWIAAQVANAAAGGTGMAYSQSGGNVSAPAPWSNFAEQEIAVRKALAASGRTDYPGYDPILGYAAGGYHAGGLRIVGENGPELEATGPSRIWSAPQTERMLGGSNDDTADAIRELKAEVVKLNAKLANIEDNTKATSEVLDDVARNRTSFATRAA